MPRPSKFQRRWLAPADWALRERHLQDRVPISVLARESHLGTSTCYARLERASARLAAVLARRERRHVCPVCAGRGWVEETDT